MTETLKSKCWLNDGAGTQARPATVLERMNMTITEIIMGLDRAISARREHLDDLDNTERIYTEREHAESELELLKIIRKDIHLKWKPEIDLEG